jgi:hypothetical protein
MGIKDKNVEDYNITSWKPHKEEKKDHVPTQQDLLNLWGFGDK